MVIYNKSRKDIGKSIRMLCERKLGVILLEIEECSYHIHLLLEIASKHSIVEFMGNLKSKSTMIEYFSQSEPLRPAQRSSSSTREIRLKFIY